MIKYFLVAVLIYFTASIVNGDVKIEFPEDELATESVLPVFEEKIAIKNRNVKHAGRFELNFMAGMVASEPLYSPFNFGGSLTYHIDNTHAVHLMGTFYTGGLNNNGEALKNGNVILADGSSGEIAFDAEDAPSKEVFLAAHYQYTAYYGKISLTKDFVMNLTLSGLIGGGAYLMSDVVAPAVDVGLSQRFYFNSNFALRFDIILSAFNGPDITSAGALDPNDNIRPRASDFKKTLQFDSNLFLGFSLLL